ncbi:hypothetical protein C5O22_01135 [Treponema sp. J25]|nr:hypothetical protein C5O22_01135 [Treponema sp. J25]
MIFSRQGKEIKIEEKSNKKVVPYRPNYYFFSIVFVVGALKPGNREREIIFFLLQQRGMWCLA